MAVAPVSPAVKPAGRPPRADASKVMTTFVLIVVTLYFGRDVLIPVTLALLLTFLLAAPVTWFRRIYFGRVPSVVLVVSLALAILIGIGTVIGGQLEALTADLPNYASTIEAKIATVKSDTLERFSQAINRLGTPGRTAARSQTAPSQAAKAAPHQPPPPGPAVPAAASPAAASPAAAVPRAAVPAAPTARPLLTPSIEQSLPSPWTLAAHYISPIISPLATIGIVFVVAVFALLQREDLRDRLIRLIGPDDIHRTTLALDDAGRRLTRYFLTQASVNTAFGAVIAIGLYFIGVPKPILWGLLTAILRFIPYVGAFISAALPIALAAAVEPGWSMAVYTFAFYLVAETVTGQVLEPLIYGQSSGLSPFSVIVAAIFWSWLWGPVGLFLSTPLTLCLAVMGRHMKGLEFLDVLLGDRAALTPTESFYQRILADDADEALDQAEAMLREMPLARYYDEVALPGMQLAAQDAELGILTEAQQENVKTTIYELVEGLAEHQEKHREDKKPAIPEDAAAPNAASLPSAVLSIAGRGPLDEPAARMLVQLFEQQGMGSRLVRYRDVSRYGIENLDLADVSMVCIAYLNISGSPAHLRYLVQRLRKRLPGLPILVGLWPQGDVGGETKSAIGADFFASSFEDVLKCCKSASAARAARESEAA
jgi:predicted PurR-regulated permease PerM